VDRDFPQQPENGIDLVEPLAPAPSEQFLSRRGQVECPVVADTQQAGAHESAHRLLDLFVGEDRMVECISSLDDTGQVTRSVLNGDRRGEPRIGEPPAGHRTMIAYAPSGYQPDLITCTAGPCTRETATQFVLPAPAAGVMWANVLRAFQVGNALVSQDGPSSRMRESRSAWAQVSWPACHLTKASASAVM
jgi:hypothetical protein